MSQAPFLAALAAAGAFLFGRRRPTAAEPAPPVVLPSPPKPERDRLTLPRDRQLRLDELDPAARAVVAGFGLRVRPRLLVAVAWVESTWRPWVIGDDGRSIGLMQVMHTTAVDLAANFGFTAYGSHPSRDELLTPEICLYYGASYLSWLGTYGGVPRSEDSTLAAYNAGPGNVFRKGWPNRPYVDKVRSAEIRHYGTVGG